MKLILVAVCLYAGFVLHVALHYSELAAWAPNLTLVVGLAAARRRGSVVWAAVAGLLCDCLFGRPLGTTMLVATLVVTIARHLASLERRTGWQSVAATFIGIATIETVARMLVGITTADGDLADAFLAALRIASTSAATAAIFPFAAAVAASLFPARQRLSGLARVGGNGAATRFSGRM